MGWPARFYASRSVWDSLIRFLSQISPSSCFIKMPNFFPRLLIFQFRTAFSLIALYVLLFLDSSRTHQSSSREYSSQICENQWTFLKLGSFTIILCVSIWIFHNDSNKTSTHPFEWRCTYRHIFLSFMSNLCVAVSIDLANNEENIPKIRLFRLRCSLQQLGFSVRTLYVVLCG